MCTKPLLENIRESYRGTCRELRSKSAAWNPVSCAYKLICIITIWMLPTKNYSWNTSYRKLFQFIQLFCIHVEICIFRHHSMTLVMDGWAGTGVSCPTPIPLHSSFLGVCRLKHIHFIDVIAGRDHSLDLTNNTKHSFHALTPVRLLRLKHLHPWEDFYRVIYILLLVLTLFICL